MWHIIQGRFVSAILLPFSAPLRWPCVWSSILIFSVMTAFNLSQNPPECQKIPSHLKYCNISISRACHELCIMSLLLNDIPIQQVSQWVPNSHPRANSLPIIISTYWSNSQKNYFLNREFCKYCCHSDTREEAWLSCDWPLIWVILLFT